MTLLCLIPGPSRVLAAYFEERPRWCFGCRRRVRYNLRCLGDPLPSYYEPIWTYECPHCHQDAALFPGWVREYDE